MKVFIGCYTKKLNDEIIGQGKGIYCCDFNSKTGQLTLLETTSATSPSYLVISKDNNYLFAIEEINQNETPKIKAFQINTEDNKEVLSLINEQEIAGSYPCHINLNTTQSHVLVACYMTGNMLAYPITKEGRLLPATQNQKHSGSGPNKARQEAAHAHMVYPFGDNQHFVVDLGIDTAKAYVFSETTENFIGTPELDISIAKGGGARHMAMHPNENYAFVFAELTSELFSFKRKEANFVPLEVAPSLPKDYKETPSGAAIRMHANGKFIYVANRGHESIAVFHFNEETEKLAFVERVSSGGKTPREINIDPSGKWLLVANQDSHNIVVFSINQTTGSLKQHAVNTEIKSASCICFLDY